MPNGAITLLMVAWMKLRVIVTISEKFDLLHSLANQNQHTKLGSVDDRKDEQLAAAATCVNSHSSKTFNFLASEEKRKKKSHHRIRRVIQLFQTTRG